MNDSIPLASLAAGQTAAIERISGDPSQVHRLHELGMHHGTRVQMIRPGSPCVVRLAGHKLCFRQNNGLEVRVKPFGGG